MIARQVKKNGIFRVIRTGAILKRTTDFGVAYVECRSFKTPLMTVCIPVDEPVEMAVKTDDT